RKLIQPSYHRQLSRTLGIFSSLVESVVERNEGMLVYCGGDDVLALLPADKALKCANELRKLFRGEGIGLEVDGHKYEAENGILHVDGKRFAPLMGERATISAGISVVHHKFPLQVAVKLAREAEEKAKEDYGRDSFVVHFVRRSGQITEVGSKWKVGGLDVVEELECLFNLMIELNVSRRSLYKLLSDDIQILSQDESVLQKFVHYVIRRSIHGETEEKKEKVKMFANRIFTFLNNYKLCCKDSNVEKALELILAFRTMKRGDER
ncbi:MAG: type III-B CRISPR-associated protein Cas10/Cmr2, partial [Pseudothermotoga sp.]|nr:type III-B CRISPR-associated protein Cas10/Cmr2 [Pseudothermotoga sp.]